MKRKQAAAVLLTLCMAFTACMLLNSVSVLAAENAVDGMTETPTVAEESVKDEDSLEDGENVENVVDDQVSNTDILNEEAPEVTLSEEYTETDDEEYYTGEFTAVTTAEEAANSAEENEEQVEISKDAEDIAEDAEALEMKTEVKNGIEGGYKDAEPIKESEVKGVYITPEHLVQFFKFEAEENGLYELKSDSLECLVEMTVYDSSLQQTGCHVDYGGERDLNEYIRFFAKKGEVIYIASTATGAEELEGEESFWYGVHIMRHSWGKTERGDMFNLANNVKVTWKEVPGAKYYKVYREGVTDPGESLDEPVIVTDRLIGWDAQPRLTNGHAYRYKIVASLTGEGDSSGDSPLSYSKLMYRLKTVVIRSVKNTVPGGVTVRYDKTTSGDSYVLQCSVNKDMSNAQTRVVKGANTTSYTFGGLKKGKTYYISIRVRKKVNGISYYTTFGVPKKITVTK